MNRIVAVIPARMRSSRFPGKPLAPLLGRTMIEHVFRRAQMCDMLAAVCVATCDEEIRAEVERFGGEALMTSAAHERASDRTAEAAENFKADIIVMIQGDEPMITPRMIAAAIEPMLKDETVQCVNLVRRILRREDYFDRNAIKVVMSARNDALYFSRSPIPALGFTDDPACDASTLARTPVFKQVCVIPFRRAFLREFARLPPTPLERIESIDMLRILERGGRVRLAEIEEETHAVDTPEDLRRVEEMMANDPLLKIYNAEGD